MAAVEVRQRTVLVHAVVQRLLMYVVSVAAPALMLTDAVGARQRTAPAFVEEQKRTTYAEYAMEAGQSRALL